MHERSGTSLRRATGAPGDDGSFCHEALFYAGAHEFAPVVAGFISGALSANDPVLVAVSAPKKELLRRTLGDAARKVVFAQMDTLGRNPGTLIAAWLRFLEEHGGTDRRASVVAEAVWPGRTGAELTECHRYEELLNVAFEGGGAWHLLCPYDIEALDGSVIKGARSTHPLVRRNGRTERSTSYMGVAAVRPLDGALPEPESEPHSFSFTIASLHELRAFVARAAAMERLDGVQIENLQLAVNELASNSVRHAGGNGALRVWREPHALVCEVSDRGRIDERLVGRVHPAPDQQSGRGLWLVNHLCDLVQIRSNDAGSVVRVFMRIDERR